MPEIPTTRRLRQEDQDFETSLCYTVRLTVSMSRVTKMRTPRNLIVMIVTELGQFTKTYCTAYFKMSELHS